MTAIALPPRTGLPPAVAGPGPSEQLTQTAPWHIQDQLALIGSALPGVEVRPSFVCVPGTRAWHLAPTLAHGPTTSFLSRTEFGHIHPFYDGSLHLVLPPDLVRAVVEARWGRACTSFPQAVLVYGPRTDDEANLVWSLVRAAHRMAAGSALRPRSSTWCPAWLPCRLVPDGNGTPAQ